MITRWDDRTIEHGTTLPCGCILNCIVASRELSIKYCLTHAAAPLMLEALKKVEWIHEDYYGNYCPWCGSIIHKGHSPDCPRQAAIAAAEPDSHQAKSEGINWSSSDSDDLDDLNEWQLVDID